MIPPFSSEFLTPAKKFRRLSVLLAIHNDPRTSQHKIGRKTHLSSSMVNNYIRAFQREGLITVNGKTNRTQSYHLTPSGHDQLIALLLAYSSEIIRLYGSAKREVAEKLNHLYTEGIGTVVLFGAAETAEVVHTAAKETPLKVTGVVDSDRAKQGTPFNGFLIQKPEALKQIKADAVLITSFARQAEIRESIHRFMGKEMKVKTLSDL
ncbi:MAG: winged helix-turn-helix domain-containing protein [Deltaproteobacteria bacterium]|nr:winged helix-turn-helix domain-containing protein [Deltaproteobacteria bacterium]